MDRAYAIVTLAISMAGGAAWAQAPQRFVNPGTPAPECSVHVKFDRNAELPGYLQQREGSSICVPFMPTNRLIPHDYKGGDYYGEEFTDSKIRARWAECRKDAACAARVRAAARPFVSYEARDTGTVDPAGRFDPETSTDLKPIRRPAYFAKAPFDEPIAAAEAHTYTIEFSAPRDGFERVHLNKNEPVRLRGWYLVGAGVDDGAGGRVRALVIMNGGGGSELTAIDDPRSDAVRLTAETGHYTAARFPDHRTEEPGQRHWRTFLHALHAAGFDVLAVDRRGNGISGGVSGFNTAEQANDMFRMLDQLDSGDGLRVLGPNGELKIGKRAVEQLFGARGSANLPVVIGGYSRGSYATAWAMHKNFVEDCEFDQAERACRPARGLSRIKGAILFGPNSGGLGYRSGGLEHELIEAALRSEFDTTYYPDASVFAHISRWPGVLIARGLWDYVEGLEGSFDAWQRAREPKDIFVFRGPHALAAQASENISLAAQRMVAFVSAAVRGHDRVPGALHPADLKALVLSSPEHWEASNRPRP